MKKPRATPRAAGRSETSSGEKRKEKITASNSIPERKKVPVAHVQKREKRSQKKGFFARGREEGTPPNPLQRRETIK